VRGEHRRGHHDDARVLDRGVAVPDAVDPPERRDQIRVERVEAGRMIPLGGVPGLGDRPRDLCELELVGEEPRRDVAARLPAVEHTKPEEGAGERDRPVEAIDRGNRNRGRSFHYGCATPSTTSGSRSVSRRTKRHGTSAFTQARTIASRRSAGACGMVTSTESGWVTARIRSMSTVPPRTETPSSRRRWRRGSSSTKPTTL